MSTSSRRGPKIRRHSKIDRVLSEADRLEFQALVARPGTTYQSALRWVRDRGYQMSEWPVRNYMRRYDENLQELRRASELAFACAELAREFGVEAVSEAALARFQQLHMQRLFDMKSAAEISSKEWVEIVKAIGSAVHIKRDIDEMRRAFEQTKREAAAAAERAAGEGADGAAVVEKVKKILGV